VTVRLAVRPDLTRASLTLEHAPGNIVTAEMVAHLRAAVADLADVRPLRLVTLEAAGADFSFGASVPEHAPDQIGHVLPAFHQLILELLDVPAPTAAIVRGRCLGGGFELALACDLIMAGESATFGLPEIALGVFPPAASVLLPLRVGAGRALSAIADGRARAASEWREAGLVERVVPDAGLAPAVDAWFDGALARHSAETLRHVVRAVREPLRQAVRARLPEVEALYLTDLMRTEDAREGVAAFLEKRRPRWRDE
jgi:cyclohexa-1,5-dienecarbonyl-CoA hydratase